MHNRPHPPRTPVSGEDRYRNNDKHGYTARLRIGIHMTSKRKH